MVKLGSSASPALHRSPRLIQLAEPRQCSREMEMRDGIISVCVEAPAQPDDRFGIGIELHLGEADKPSIDRRRCREEKGGMPR